MEHRIQRCSCTLFIVLAVAAIAPSTSAQTGRVAEGQGALWVDATGQHKIEAAFVRLDQQNVVLRRADGKEISVPLAKLSAASQDQARAAARAGSSAAPSTAAGSNKPRASSSQGSAAAIPDDLGAKEFVDLVYQRARDGDGIVVWDVLPTRYQNDIEKVVSTAANKIDPSFMAPLKQTKTDLMTVLRTKKSFILNTPMLKNAIDDPQLAMACYDPLVDLVDALLGDELFDVKSMQKGELRPVLATYLTRLSEKSKNLEGAIPKDHPSSKLVQGGIQNMKYEFKSIAKDRATLVIQPPNAPPKDMELVAVEGRWLPAEMAEGWDQKVAAALAEIEKLTPQKMQEAKQTMQMPLMMVGGMLAGFLNANDQASFDEAVGGVMQMLPMGGGMPMGPGFGPGGAIEVPAN